MKRITKITAAYLLATSLMSASAQNQIIPKPVSFEVLQNVSPFKLNAQTVIVQTDPLLSSSVTFFNNYLQSNFGFKLATASKASAGKNVINLRIAKGAIKEAYEIKVASNAINISGQDGAGTFYGLQTLIQMLPTTRASTIEIVPVVIKDQPRFDYRGMHLDVARHYFPVEFIYKYLDYLAMHKINRFHWHLTDDQGWRIEIKKYPRLTSVGGFRNGTITGHHPGDGNTNKQYGGFYTQEEVKKVVKYAADRFITVIPEIEMPGHASAAIAAYPQLSSFPDEPTKIEANTPWSGPRTGKQVQQTFGVFPDVFAPTEYTFGFLEDVIDEVITLFPSKLIHIGGDECPKDNWKRSKFAQDLIKEKGLKDEHELQSYFIQRMEKYINAKGRTIIGWDEILEGGLAPNAVVMSWRGEEGGIEAAKQGHFAIMTPGSHVYFDHAQSKPEDSLTIGGFTPVEKTYAYEPVPAVLDATTAKYIMGAQANLWTEYITNPAKVTYQIFPRMTALSEVLWSRKEDRNWDDFKRRLLIQTQRYDLWKVTYAKTFLRPAQ